MGAGLVLLGLIGLVAALALAGTQKPDRKPPPPQPPNTIPHPWSNGNPRETDDFAGPNAVYGPGTDED
jgi:hypothetical protein